MLRLAVFALACAFSEAKACQPHRLQDKMAKEVASELRSAKRRHGCDFDGVDCRSTDGGGLSCDLGPPSQTTSPKCVPSILRKSIERELGGEIRDAQRKYGCKRVTSVRCGKDDPSRPEWVHCNVVFSSESFDEDSRSAASSAASGACDLTILTNTLSHELFLATQKAHRRYDCPWVKSVHCVSDPDGWIDCSMQTNAASDITIPSTCNMAALTEAVSSEFGEEVGDAESKYDCPIPPYIACNMNTGAGNTYTCTIGSSSRSSQSSSSTGGMGGSSSSSSSRRSDNGAQGAANQQNSKKEWSSRYFRGRRTL